MSSKSSYCHAARQRINRHLFPRRERSSLHHRSFYRDPRAYSQPSTTFLAATSRQTPVPCRLSFDPPSLKHLQGNKHLQEVLASAFTHFSESQHQPELQCNLRLEFFGDVDVKASLCRIIRSRPDLQRAYPAHLNVSCTLDRLCLDCSHTLIDD